MGQMTSDGGMWLGIGNFFMRVAGYYDCTWKTSLQQRVNKAPKIWNNKTPNFKTPIWESQDKMPFGCNPHEKTHDIL
jgi:hypothetical protein